MLATNLGLYKRGSYVRLILKGLGESQRDSLKPTYPMVLARIEIGEDNLGFVKIKIKKHRWYPNILKSNDPLIFSVGWRRF
jgi:ribosome biogenesis protein BMS1